jgi:hypothetical protein
VQVKEWPLEARRSMKGKIDAIIGVAKLREIVASLNGELHCYHHMTFACNNTIDCSLAITLLLHVQYISETITNT